MKLKGYGYILKKERIAYPQQLSAVNGSSLRGGAWREPHLCPLLSSLIMRCEFTRVTAMPCHPEDRTPQTPCPLSSVLSAPSSVVFPEPWGGGNIHLSL